jgi:hypothetical protein
MPNYPYSFQLPPLNVQDIPNNGAVGEFLGISAGGVLDWLPVASGGGDMLKADNLSGLASYPTARTNLGLGTGDSPTFKNLTISTGTIATSAPVTISQTWADVAQTFKALVVNAAGTSDANSASGSLLADFQVNGVSKFKADKAGVVTAGNSFNLPNGPLIREAAGGAGGQRAIVFYNGGDLPFGVNQGVVSIRNDYPLIWASSVDSDTPTPTLALQQDGAANTLALRNGAAAQTFRVYGSYPDTGINYARLALSCDTSGNATISTQALGTFTAGTVSINGVPVGLGKGNISSNIAIGSNALLLNTTGPNNLAVGINTLLSNSTGSGNLAIGTSSSLSNTTGGNNISIGTNALYSNTTGNYNLAIGFNAARYLADGSTANATGANSVFLGAETKALGAEQANQIVIGYGATGLGNDSVVLGNSSISKTALRGNVGIGTTAPNSRLEVRDITNNANTVGQMLILSSDALAADKGGRFGLGGIWDGVGGTALWAEVAGLKENATSGNWAGYITFRTRPAGGAITDRLRIDSTGNVGIGTTAPSSKLHVEDATSPTLTIKNTSATGYSQVLLANTVVPGSGFWVNGSAQVNYGGASSFNIYAAASNIAFHTASATNALSIAQSGAITYTSSVLSASGSSGALGSAGIERTYINQNGARIFGFDSGLFLLGAAYSSANPAIKRNGTELQARLADDLAFTFIQGKLKTDTAYTGTVVAATTGYITIYDSTGTAYRVPCVV